MPQRVLLLDLAALSRSQITERTPNLLRLAATGAMTPLVPPFGALTCPAHASMLTGVPPSEHGIVGNGWYERDHAKIFNWGRSAHLIGAELIYDEVRRRAPDARCASLMWRYAAHSSADLKVMERPTYWASGRKSFDFYTEPGDLHARVKAELGGFPFPQFWGPMAGHRSTAWILGLVQMVLAEERPTLTCAYAPVMDYDGQRYGPDDPRSIASLARLDADLGPVLAAAEADGVDVAVVSDYGFVTVDRPVFLNRHLRGAGWLEVHDADNGEMLEPGACRAFAHADNQLAHVYVRDPADLDAVAGLLSEVEGVAQVLDADGIRERDLGHSRSGDLVAVAERDAWFAYPYWLDEAKAPDLTRCIAIFDKPGFDPCELNLPPGIGGKLHMARRLLQKILRLAVPFDVIDPDPSRIGGARNIDRDDLDHGGLLITNWTRDEAISLPTEAVRDVVLARMFG